MVIGPSGIHTSQPAKLRQRTDVAKMPLTGPWSAASQLFWLLEFAGWGATRRPAGVLARSSQIGGWIAGKMPDALRQKPVLARVPPWSARRAQKSASRSKRSWAAGSRVASAKFTQFRASFWYVLAALMAASREAAPRLQAQYASEKIGSRQRAQAVRKICGKPPARRSGSVSSAQLGHRMQARHSVQNSRWPTGRAAVTNIDRDAAGRRR